jgi:predicted phosphohydrolase
LFADPLGEQGMSVPQSSAEPGDDVPRSPVTPSRWCLTTSPSLRLAFTADLHWRHQQRGDEATRSLAAFLRDRPPDVLVLGGDIGAGAFFADCLSLFADLPCRKALLPGNHDIWVPTDAPLDSLQRYEEELPRAAAAHGFHYLDHGPLVFPEVDLAIVGSINWYDYSWSLDAIREHFPADEHRLRSKLFTRGRHNDANFVRWPLDDLSFTARVVERLERQLDEALGQVGRAVVVTHHPACRDLGFDRGELPATLDAYLWDAFCGNRRLEDFLRGRADRLALLVSGHTHRARQAVWNGVPAHNIGGDYHFKRLLLFDWPAGRIEQHVFGDAP